MKTGFALKGKLKNLFLALYDNIINSIRSLRIYYRLVIAFFALIIIPSLIIGYSSYSIASNQIENNTSNYMYQYVSNINTNTDEKLKKYEDITSEICNDYEILGLLKDCREKQAIQQYLPTDTVAYPENKKRLNNLLYGLSGNDRNILNLEIVTYWDEFTQINSLGVAKGGKINQIASFKDTNYYQKALAAPDSLVWYDSSKDNITVLDQKIGNYSIMNNITLLRAIPAPEGGAPLGVIVMNISLNVFSSSYHDFDIISSGNLLLVGEQGVIKSLNENVNGPFLDAETLREISEKKSGMMKRNTSGVECILSFRQSDYTGWIVVSVIPQKALLQKMETIQQTIIETVAVCLALSIVLSYIVTLSISRPLSKLKQLMNSFSETNTDIRYSDSKKDDIGILGEKFNNMLGRINHLINIIYKTELQNREEEAKRKQAELDALQMQINPHFLYNTLDVIRWEVISQENGEGKGSKMISQFSDLLRLSTKRCGNLVDIQEEFDHIEAYIKVISFSYTDEFTVQWLVRDDSIRRCKITKLTLQPIVENAIVHGFKKARPAKEISIQAEYGDGHTVVLRISDNGAGMDKEKLNRVREALMSDEGGTGLGLRNVNERLRLAFGPEYGISIESAADEGTAVTITIPAVGGAPGQKLPSE